MNGRRISVFILVFSTMSGAVAQSPRDVLIEMDTRLSIIERRLDSLERERNARVDIERQAERDRQSDAIVQLAATCRRYRQNPASVALFNDCKTKKRPGQPEAMQCLDVEIDEMACHSSAGYNPPR